jgi:hypothetical protein
MRVIHLENVVALYNNEEHTVYVTILGKEIRIAADDTVWLHYEVNWEPGMSTMDRITQ